MSKIMLAVTAGVYLLFSEPGTSHPQGSTPPVARTVAGADRALSAVERVSVDRNAINSTIEALQLLDANGQNGVVLWVGVIEGRRARVLMAVVLVRDATDNEADDAFEPPDKLERMNRALSHSGLRPIAEVHTSTTAILDSGFETATSSPIQTALWS